MGAGRDHGRLHASIAPEGPLASADRFYPRVFGLTAAAVLGYFLLRLLEPFLAPALWAALLALMLFPVNRRLRARLRGKKAFAATLVTLLVLLGLVLPGVTVGYGFFDQAVELARNLSETAARYRIAGVEDILRLPVIGNGIAWAQERFGLDPVQLQTWLIDTLRRVVNWILKHGRDAVVGALGVVANLTLMLFLLFFFFRDGDETIGRLLDLVPLDPGRKERLVARLAGVTRAVVNGTVVTAIVQGTLV
ncbi:MAG: AI-2E family transporter, partial [Thermoanaerobaculia bacterium]